MERGGQLSWVCRISCICWADFCFKAIGLDERKSKQEVPPTHTLQPFILKAWKWKTSIVHTGIRMVFSVFFSQRRRKERNEIETVILKFDVANRRSWNIVLHAKTERHRQLLISTFWVRDQTNPRYFESIFNHVARVPNHRNKDLPNFAWSKTNLAFNA